MDTYPQEMESALLATVQERDALRERVRELERALSTIHVLGEDPEAVKAVCRSTLASGPHDHDHLEGEDATHKPLDYSGNREAFLNRAFEAEDGCISVGGLANELGMLKPENKNDDD